MPTILLRNTTLWLSQLCCFGLYLVKFVRHINVIFGDNHHNMLCEIIWKKRKITSRIFQNIECCMWIYTFSYLNPIFIWYIKTKTKWTLKHVKSVTDNHYLGLATWTSTSSTPQIQSIAKKEKKEKHQSNHLVLRR